MSERVEFTVSFRVSMDRKAVALMQSLAYAPEGERPDALEQTARTVAAFLLQRGRIAPLSFDPLLSELLPPSASMPEAKMDDWSLDFSRPSFVIFRDGSTLTVPPLQEAGEPR